MKKYLIILAGGLGLLLGAIFAIQLASRPTVVTPIPLITPEPTSVSAPKLQSWKDPAGFKFNYPAEIKINPHEEDKKNYANLELSITNHPGGVRILVKDTTYNSIDSWLKKEATPGGQIIESTLGGKPARKVAYLTPKKIITATIDVDALVLLEVTLDEERYWQEVYNGILSSFEFTPLAGEPEEFGSTTSEEERVIEESEEVVE